MVPDRGCAPLGGSSGMGAVSMTGIPVGVGASEVVVNELATDGAQGGPPRVHAAPCRVTLCLSWSRAAPRGGAPDRMFNCARASCLGWRVRGRSDGNPYLTFSSLPLKQTAC